MNIGKLNCHLWLLVTLAVAIIAIIYSSAVVNADGGYSVNATVNVTGGGDGGGSPGGGGPGGGGGGASGATSLLHSITMEGRITEDVTAESLDHKVEIFIPKGTIAKNRVGSLLYTIFIKEEMEPPAPPIGAKRISLCYDIGPAGAIFDPMVELTFKYDDTEIPEGVTEANLVIAKYDWATKQWQKLESTVDPDYNTVTTRLSYFSTYAVLAYTSPANFTIADLSVNPAEVNIGESVIISVLVTNTGDLTGVYEVFLTINYVVAVVVKETREITLDSSDSQMVNFKVLPNDAGKYTVDINGLSGEFTVKVPAPTPISEPTPAPEPKPVLEPEPEPTPTPEPEVTTWVTIPKIQFTREGINWELMLIVYGAMMVVVGVLIYLQKRTK